MQVRIASPRYLDSYAGPATIMVDGGDPFDVDCHFVVEQSSRRKGWRGTFSTEAAMPTTGNGRIYLPAGHSGHILVTAWRPSTGRGSFVGRGDPPGH